jgi:hypothetical protein
MFERISYYFIFNELLVEFLSNDEFKFVKMWEDWDADMGMMPPAGAWRPFGPRGGQCIILLFI